MNVYMLFLLVAAFAGVLWLAMRWPWRRRARTENIWQDRPEDFHSKLLRDGWPPSN